MPQEDLQPPSAEDSPTPAPTTEVTQRSMARRVGSAILRRLQRQSSTDTRLDHLEAGPLPVPSLATQANDESLTGGIQYVVAAEPQLEHLPHTEGEAAEPPTEHESLVSLQRFLQGYIDTVGDHGIEQDAGLREQAQNMLDHLTYISEPLRRQATRQIAASLRTYLEGDSDRKIYLWSTPRKSNEFLLDEVLGQLGSDLEKYKDRLRFVDEVLDQAVEPPSPGTYKIVTVEDWIATGRQISKAYWNDIERLWPESSVGDKPPTEVYLIAATSGQIQDGITTQNPSSGVHIPVTAVYRANETPDGKPFVTGAHSSTDDYFEVPIGRMVQSLREHHNQPDALMPQLTNIVRPYRSFEYQPANIDHLHTLQGSSARSRL